MPSAKRARSTTNSWSSLKGAGCSSTILAMAAISDVFRSLLPQSPPQGDQRIDVPHTGPGLQFGGAGSQHHDGIDLTPHLKVVARNAGRYAAQMREQQAAKPVNLILNLRSSSPA